MTGMETDPQEPRAEPSPGLRLAELKAGDRARLAARELDRDEWALLRALGLSERSTFRVAQAGDPWILQVRSTRIGLTRDLAQKIWVTPRGTA